MQGQIILNADDFGRSAGINAAVIRAHREGVLTSASLMVAGEAAGEAVELARATPTLAVGLHLVVLAGRAILPPARIPHLVDAAGRFSDDPLRAGLAYFFSRRAQAELQVEISAQFERFAATGLPLAHVDGHCHFHVHPTVFRLLLPLAGRYGAHGVRLPRDDLWLGLRNDARGAGGKAAQAIAFALLCRWCERRRRSSRLIATRRVYGLMQSGQMRAEYVAGALRGLEVPTAELYFHPSIEPCGERLGPNPDDLATLLHPAVKEAIQERGLRLATYATLVEE